MKKENADIHTAVNQTIVNTLMIKEDNNRLRTCIDNRIVELKQQLKDNTKQVCEKIIDRMQNIEFNCDTDFQSMISILDQIEKGE